MYMMVLSEWSRCCLLGRPATVGAGGGGGGGGRSSGSGGGGICLSVLWQYRFPPWLGQRARACRSRRLYIPARLPHTSSSSSCYLHGTRLCLLRPRNSDMLLFFFTAGDMLLLLLLIFLEELYGHPVATLVQVTVQMLAYGKRRRSCCYWVK